MNDRIRKGVFACLGTGMLTAPLLVVAADPAGQRDTLYSVVAVIPAGLASTIANATTLSTALAALLTTSGNPAGPGANLKTLVTPDAVSAPLAVPPAPANYLALVTGQLAACLSGTQGSTAPVSACPQTET
ncbi:hypothetical protein [Paraburkholderia gardini]|uniref:Killing trait domain-containing protein n=1 Tax=Paraburkholderia gardini TaxID=2823469 RepID=A0ABM8U3A4_9BURK|nr:hypothetical protein [Paraburkholderia gardini]CAG4897609.1 hypothetical protein R54767_02291 [Paraburkholderia gardini]